MGQEPFIGHARKKEQDTTPVHDLFPCEWILKKLASVYFTIVFIFDTAIICNALLNAINFLVRPSVLLKYMKINTNEILYSQELHYDLSTR